MALSKQDILKQFASRRYDEVQGIRLQSLTELELSKLESLWAQRYHDTKQMNPVMRRELLCLCIVDDEGNRIFSNDEVDALAELDGGVTSQLYSTCRVLCGLDEPSDAGKKAKKLEETTV